MITLKSVKFQKCISHLVSHRFIHSINRAGLSFQLKINHLVDRFDHELIHLRGKLYSKPEEKSKFGELPFDHDVEKEKNNLPEVWDWRISGAVTPVKGMNYLIIKKQNLINYFILT